MLPCVCVCVVNVCVCVCVSDPVICCFTEMPVFIPVVFQRYAEILQIFFFF